MSKTTIETLEKVIKKFLTPIETKIDQVISELNKLQGKIVKLEGYKNECQSCRANISSNAPKDFKPKTTQIAPNQAKNPIQPRATATLPIAVREQPVAAGAGGRRGSLPPAGPAASRCRRHRTHIAIAAQAGVHSSNVVCKHSSRARHSKL
ncbi:hypothetical protein O0L34_g18977 [Tuta absoluta]|nr:hypothetical protein O0L34_g18977 [Tuta absoluta]